VSSCHHIENAVFLSVPAGMFTSVQLSWCVHLTDLGLQALCKSSQSSLVSLSIAGCRNITDAAVQFLAEICWYVCGTCIRLFQLGIVMDWNTSN
jgi:hypothetical protein